MADREMVTSAPSSHPRWLPQTAAFFGMLLLYAASVGPVLRLVQMQVVPAVVMAVYAPLWLIPVICPGGEQTFLWYLNLCGVEIPTC